MSNATSDTDTGEHIMPDYQILIRGEGGTVDIEGDLERLRGLRFRDITTDGQREGRAEGFTVWVSEPRPVELRLHSAFPWEIDIKQMDPRDDLPFADALFDDLERLGGYSLALVRDGQEVVRCAGPASAEVTLGRID